jgi:hypothetical protein
MRLVIDIARQRLFIFPTGRIEKFRRIAKVTEAHLRQHSHVFDELSLLCLLAEIAVYPSCPLTPPDTFSPRGQSPIFG